MSVWMSAQNLVIPGQTVLVIFEGLISCRTNIDEACHMRLKRFTDVSPKNYLKLVIRETLDILNKSVVVVYLTSYLLHLCVLALIIFLKICI